MTVTVSSARPLDAQSKKPKATATKTNLTLNSTAAVELMFRFLICICWQGLFDSVFLRFDIQIPKWAGELRGRRSRKSFHGQQREQQFRHPMRFLEMRITRQDQAIDAET